MGTYQFKTLKIVVSTMMLSLAVLALLIYQYKNAPFKSAVFVQFPDGYVRQISPDDGGIYYEANINNNGTEVTFFGANAGSPRIWIADVKTGESSPITSEDYGSRHPSFSRDGERIVFSSDMAFDGVTEDVRLMKKEGEPPKKIHTNIYMMNRDGGNIKQLTFGMYRDLRPTFSPDGDTVVFVSNRSGEIRIWKLELENETNIPEIILPDLYAYRPIFSPDGQWLYFFVHKSRERHQICRLKIENENVQCLENDSRGYTHGPFVAPDGQSVYVHSTRGGGNWKIWRIPLDGSEPLSMQPVFFSNTLHPSISTNGIMAFDSILKPEPLETLLRIKKTIIP